MKRLKKTAPTSCRLLLLLLLCGFAAACSKTDSSPSSSSKRILNMSLGKRINTLDPALAADTSSQYVVAAFYDTPLQYRYWNGDYTLEPSMLRAMPEISPDLKRFRCVLRDDLYFQDGPPFRNLPKEARRIHAADVVFSLLRLADPRLQSPGYWLIRDKVSGLKEFRERALTAPPNDFSPYDAGCSGLKVIDDFTFEVSFDAPAPRFVYALALPYCSVVSRRAVEHYSSALFADFPLGSGPFRLQEWNKDYSIRMIRNPEYRLEYFRDAVEEADRTRPLPLLDEITCYLVRQPLASWLMFLQGELDFYALDGDNFEAVVNEKHELTPALTARGIRMIQAPMLETNYIGFNFADPVLGQNDNLRRAISLAFHKSMRVRHSGGRFSPAYGPIPPGVPGYLPDTGPFGEMNLARAKDYLAQAGYPDGIDPKTGKPLELSFDQSGSDTFYRQTAELMAADLKQIGIQVRSELNNRPRFLQKLAAGQFQMFRFSWTGDYPDAENFLQLFYGPNSGSCNRIFFRDPAYDRMFEEISTMADSPERTRKYREMSAFLRQKCPWVFETHTMAFILAHTWMFHYIPHDFAFNRWKYFSVDPKKRSAGKRSFQPLSMNELR